MSWPTPLPDYDTCKVCGDPLDDPVLSKGCLHRLCRQEHRDYKACHANEAALRCPVDDTDQDTTEPDDLMSDNLPPFDPAMKPQGELIEKLLKKMSGFS